MKKLYALCLLTLLAVAADVLLFHALPAKAQTQGTVKIIKTIDGGREWTVPVDDSKVLGFSCLTSPSNVTTCYVATSSR